MIEYTNAQVKKRFLNHFAKYGGFNEAAAYAGRSSICIRQWLREDENFCAEAEDSRKQYMESLEAVLSELGVKGVLKPVYYCGRTLGYLRTHDAALLLACLKALDPEKYGDHAVSRPLVPIVSKPIRVIDM
jgi:hypothetical protein